MTYCKNCKWLAQGKSGVYYCLASEEEDDYGMVMNEMYEGFLNDDTSCGAYEEGQ